MNRFRAVPLLSATASAALSLTLSLIGHHTVIPFGTACALTSHRLTFIVRNVLLSRATAGRP